MRSLKSFDNNVEGYCPICGARRGADHRCDAKKLSAIDAADARAEDGDPHIFTIIRPTSERLLEGLKMMESHEMKTDPADVEWE